MKKVYFPNLNGIRFVAAFLVVVHHIEQLKSLYNLPSHWSDHSTQVIGGFGALGVTLFFVLSGFLITYMLFVEKDQVGTINVKDFYVRRVLRIWPLYYLIVILAFFVLPNFSQLNMPIWSNDIHHEFIKKIMLFMIFLPNAAILLYSPMPFASQLWSIGVEEQFYMVWPLLIKFFKRSLIVLFSVVIIYWTLEIIIYMLLISSKDGQIIEKLLIVKRFVEITRINCMAIGGIGAYILYKEKHKLLQILFSRFFQVLVYAVTFFLIFYGVIIKYISDEVYSLLFILIILNLAANKKTILSLNNKIFDYLGKISYGLYMYHPLAIIIAIVSVIHFTVGTNFYAYNNSLIYFFSIVMTIIFSSFSYELFEKFFIKKKLSFSRIISGENAK